MTLFGTTAYYLINTRKINPFEKKIGELIVRLELYRKQFNLTSESYLKEWNLEKKDLEDKIKKQKGVAEKHYKEIYESVKGEEYASSFALHHSGLELIDFQESEQKEELNSKYKDFLDFYSKSILTSLYSLNENKLKEICEVGSEVFEKKIKPHHFNERDYLKISFTYLELVLEIPVKSLEPYFNKLREIQFLRNKIVHEDSKFQDEKIKEIATRHISLKLEEGTGYLTIIKPDFINDLFKLIANFYEELIWLIEKKQNYSIIKNGLEYWFGLIDSDIKILELECQEIKKGKRFEFQISSNKVKNFNCKVTITNSVNSKVSIINQRDEAVFKNFVEDQKVHSDKLQEALNVFNFKNDNKNIEILIH